MTKAHIYVIDDDDNFRKSLCALIESVGMSVENWSDADPLLRHRQFRRPGCLVLDYRLPSLSGLDVLRIVRESSGIPAILLSAYADVSTTVAAIKAGAAEVFEKPLDDNLFLDALARECFEDERRLAALGECETVQAEVARLSVAEREVLDHVVAGQPTKAIAGILSKSVKAVERHRMNVIRKLRCTTSAGVIRKVQVCPMLAHTPLTCQRGSCALSRMPLHDELGASRADQR